MRKPLELERDKEAPSVSVDSRPENKPEKDAAGSGLAGCSVKLCHLELDQEGEPDDEAYADLKRAKHDDQVMQCEPKAKVPHPGVFVMPNPTGEAADTERRAA
ncbi:MAG: hypothetical protein LUC93_17355 [Planctomycetaceae bacterium]|nr:hypothetical protein [Planctomycetaceae bacterium]